MNRLHLFALVVGSLVACSYINGKGDAEKFAREWIGLHLQDATNAHVACMGRDTDDNGYVSCTVTATWPGESRAEVIPIECAVNRAGNGCDNEGCRPLAAFGVRRGGR